jgi:hypothetical protein
MTRWYVFYDPDTLAIQSVQTETNWPHDGGLAAVPHAPPFVIVSPRPGDDPTRIALAREPGGRIVAHFPEREGAPKPPPSMLVQGMPGAFAVRPAGAAVDAPPPPPLDCWHPQIEVANRLDGDLDLWIMTHDGGREHYIAKKVEAA